MIEGWQREGYVMVVRVREEEEDSEGKRERNTVREAKREKEC